DSMSTSVLRYCPPELPAVVSWYAMPSPPLSKFSALSVPGTIAGAPVKGVDPTIDSRTQFKLPIAPIGPTASNTIRMIGGPADRATGADTVVHVCQPPVLGTVSGPVTSLPPNSTWKVPPCPDDATRASSAYWPVEETLTE